MKAKQLEWDDSECGCFAYSKLGNFMVLEFEKHVQANWLGQDGLNVFTRCNDVTEAKSKCQQEYQRRVAELLEPDIESDLIDALKGLASLHEVCCDVNKPVSEWIESDYVFIPQFSAAIELLDLLGVNQSVEEISFEESYERIRALGGNGWDDVDPAKFIAELRGGDDSDYLCASSKPVCTCKECNWHMIGFSFFACQKCGNKRCPKCESHRYKCTGSNDPGQLNELEIDE